MPKRKKKVSNFSKAGAILRTVGQFLLEACLDFVELLPEPFETPYQHGKRLQGWPVTYPRYRIRQELKRLKERGWIVEAEKNGKKFLKLTEKGRLQAFYQKMKRFEVPTHRQWDGKWSLAIFDIPEKGRYERDTIRGTLRSVGFQQLQKSVYIYPYELPAEMISYLKEARLLPYIRFARVDQLDDSADLKRRFKLQ